MFDDGGPRTLGTREVPAVPGLAWENQRKLPREAGSGGRAGLPSKGERHQAREGMLSPSLTLS